MICIIIKKWAIGDYQEIIEDSKRSIRKVQRNSAVDLLSELVMSANGIPDKYKLTVTDLANNYIRMASAYSLLGNYVDAKDNLDKIRINLFSMDMSSLPGMSGIETGMNCRHSLAETKVARHFMTYLEQSDSYMVAANKTIDNKELLDKIKGDFCENSISSQSINYFTIANSYNLAGNYYKVIEILEPLQINAEMAPFSSSIAHALLGGNQVWDAMSGRIPRMYALSYAYYHIGETERATISY